MRADGHCRSCDAPIRWAQHSVTGRNMPIDAAHNPDGNVVVVDWLNVGDPTKTPTPVVAVGKAALDKAINGYRYTSHFATCPNASKHRRKK